MCAALKSSLLGLQQGWLVVTAMSGQPIGLIFRGQAVQEEC